MTITNNWQQVDGDMNPGTYGGTIARYDDESIELLKIQPVREYVGDGEALEVGHPFWTREGYFDQGDLVLCRRDVADACASSDLLPHLADMPRDQRAMFIACAMLDHEHGDEGTAGWAKDILPSPVRVLWWGSKRPSGWRYLADEDIEFRRMQREAR